MADLLCGNNSALFHSACTSEATTVTPETAPLFEEFQYWQLLFGSHSQLLHNVRKLGPRFLFLEGCLCGELRLFLFTCNSRLTYHSAIKYLCQIWLTGGKERSAQTQQSAKSLFLHVYILTKIGFGHIKFPLTTHTE